jgi:hydrogenase expression/formation protein HypC
VETYLEHDVRMGKVDFGGVSKRVCLEHVPDALVNDYVLVHVGFALSCIDEEEAHQVFRFLESMNLLDELVSSPVQSADATDDPSKERLKHPKPS